jgi:hypothetical protein
MLNHETKSIVITKAFSKNASTYGTTEYKDLIKIKNDFRDYQIVVRSVPKRKRGINDISLTDMETYIQKHDDEEKSIMSTFKSMVNEKAGENLKRTSFFTIKKWFFEQYPELKPTNESEAA